VIKFLFAPPPLPPTVWAQKPPSWALHLLVLSLANIHVCTRRHAGIHMHVLCWYAHGGLSRMWEALVCICQSILEAGNGVGINKAVPGRNKLYKKMQFNKRGRIFLSGQIFWPLCLMLL